MYWKNQFFVLRPPWDIEYYDGALILPPVGLSYHSSVLLQPSGVQPTKLQSTRIQRRDCKPANKRVLFSSLKAMNWTPLYRANTCEDKFNLFHSQITSAINSCLPVRSIKLHPTDKPWMTADIKTPSKNVNVLGQKETSYNTICFATKSPDFVKTLVLLFITTVSRTCKKPILKNGGTT